MKTMNRWLTLIAIGFAGLLAGCGSSVSSSTQPGTYRRPGRCVFDRHVAHPIYAERRRLGFDHRDGRSLQEQRGAQAAYAAAHHLVLFLRPAGDRLPRRRGLRRAVGLALPDLHRNLNPAHRIRNHHGLQCQPQRQRHQPGLGACPRRQHHLERSRLHRGGYHQLAHIRSRTGEYPAATQCVSQNNAVQYTASAVDANGNAIPNCSVSAVAGCINNNDYTWSTDNATAAQVSQYGVVVALNPGLANVYATLNGTVSAPLAFVTCPPAIHRSVHVGLHHRGTPTGPFTTADLTGLNKGEPDVCDGDDDRHQRPPADHLAADLHHLRPADRRLYQLSAADLDPHGQHLGTLHHAGLLRAAQLQRRRGKLHLAGRTGHGPGHRLWLSGLQQCGRRHRAGHHRQHGAGHRNLAFRRRHHGAPPAGL